jgi:hypothetical protein
MNWLWGGLDRVSLDVVTGIALITLLFMMLQMEHERCDRVRTGWREVRRATFAVTSAFQRAKRMENDPDARQYLEKAQGLLQELYSTILLYGKGKLREEYRTRIRETMQAKNTAPALMAIFASLDGKTERKFDSWRLRVL